jgi:glycosyltransferase involved in cell wall biosynthesis
MIEDFIVNLPPITVVLICYNQEDFIADAIRAILNQDYPNTFLVISDDSSSDGTYDAAALVLAEENTGDRAKLYRTPRNLGLLGNFAFACSKADTDLIVIAAGDDISKPERVSVIQKAWATTGADVICSEFDVVDEHGQPVKYESTNTSGHYNSGPLFKKDFQYFYAGATACYSKRILNEFFKVDYPHGSEDAGLLYFALFNNYTVYRIPQKLIYYRRHSGSMSQAGQDSIIDQEVYSQKHAFRLLETLIFLKHLTNKGNFRKSVDYKLLEKTIEHYTFRSRWIESSKVDRIKALFNAPDKAAIRWIAPRVFGIKFFSTIKKHRS